MDIFRKNKKKQQHGVVALPDEVSTSFTDQLDQIAISAAEMESDASFIDDDDEEIFVAAKKVSTKSGIDALIDSDEDGADIFNDCDESSEEADDDIHNTPSSKRSTMSRQSLSKFNDVVKVLDVVVVDEDQSSRARLSKEVVEIEDDGEEDDDSSSCTRDEDDNDDDDDKDLKSNSDSAEDYTDDDDEGEDGYKPGGYHPVKVGEVYNQRYVF